ncbi:Nif3-like dinuclear metal center hexameric protein [Numidum massiliense]|uniref:Nif3-like dinuclear metal center hexameric protein n=1 Tax=Numidum massiliense TaxID=1522315 RepID=UPI0006D5550C|nr:Nif3-like dinuclear metal center hexameric protein [Numidum massiliense]
MFAQGENIVRIFDTYVPPHLAVEGDRIGLQVGTLKKEVKKVMLALDVTMEVVEEAIRNHIDLIIAHHAVIFRPLKTLSIDSRNGRVYEKLIKHDIAVYVAHTNWDVAPDGVNDVLAARLSLQQTRVLSPVYLQPLKKLVVFVPETHHEEVLQALGAAGAGWIGKYSHCTFNVPGTGTFQPEEGAEPFIGSTSRLERVAEIRLETVVTAENERAVVAAMLAAHPYEEVAYDLYPLELKGKTFGLGRIGRLEKAETLKDFSARVKEAYGLEALRVVGNPTRTVRRVALLGGMGTKYLADAVRERADVYITGDIDYHTAHDALAEGIALIDPGHHVEHLVLAPMRDRLAEALAKTDTVVSLSKIDTNPFRYV